MVRAKNYENMSTFVKVMQKKTVVSFPDTVYIGLGPTISNHSALSYFHEMTRINSCNSVLV